MQEVIIGSNQAGQRLDKFLHKFLPNAGNSFLYKMLRKKNITLNGKKAEGKEILQLNDIIQCFFSDETFSKFSGKSTSVQESSSKQNSQATLETEYFNAYNVLDITDSEILYEDENVLIINKPAGILTQKAKPNDISLNEWMIGYLLKHNKLKFEELTLFKPSICNRLDRNTSGVVLCGVSLKGSQILSKLIKEREIGKFYRTICKGTLNNKCVLEGSLKKDTKTNTVSISLDGSEIKTSYEPLKKLKNNLTYLEVELITGKTHQIRAHLSGIGHPLLGDTKYGDRSLNQTANERYHLKHQLLHAYRVEFPKIIGELDGLSQKVIIAPLPDYFQKILEDLS